MSSGNDVQSGRNTTGESTTVLIADTTNDDPPVDFNGDTIFIVGPRADAQVPFHTINGIVGLGWNGNVEAGSQGGTGVIGAGGPNQGTGVTGLGGATGNGNGGTGVQGFGGQGTSFGFAAINPGIGVFGQGGGVDPISPPPEPGAPGVMGIAGAIADGVVGISNAANRSGVFGFNGQSIEQSFGVFGRCDSPAGVGVGAYSQEGVGLASFSVDGYAIYGRSENRHAVFGDARDAGAFSPAYGVYGVTSNTWGVVGLIDSTNPDPDATAVVGVAAIQINPDNSISYIGQAGLFEGPVYVLGDLVVTGAKNAAVQHHDGSHRLLYCMESPESWFEDFGEGSLVMGRTHIDLDPDFAALIHTQHFHVFITPYGDCKGLYVTGRSKDGFDVIEAGNGKSDVGFSYRVVAKRKDIDGKRFAKVKLPSTAGQQQVSEPKVEITSNHLREQFSNVSTIPAPPVPKVPIIKD